MDEAPISHYNIKAAIVAPLIVFALAVVLCITKSPWWLLAIPSAYLGSVCGQPNLNLADGFLAYVAIVGGLVLAQYHQLSGYAIALGVAMAYFLSAFEKFVRAEPVRSPITHDSKSQGE